MNTTFIDILKKLTAEQGKEALLNPAKCKAFLADYTKGEYKKESRLLLQALEAGVQKAIADTEELEICKQQQVRVLQEEYFLAAEIASDVVDTLVLILKGETLKPMPSPAPVVKTPSPTPVVPSQKAKHTKRIVLIAGIILLVVILIVWQASLFNTFEVVKAPNGDGVMINKYHGSKQEVRIPSRILIFPVTSIGDYAFFGCDSLTNITIPDSVTTIGKSTFPFCTSLTTINVVANNSVYTSENGVLYNKKKTILIQYPAGKKDVYFTIPNSVTSIGQEAFYGCASLTSVTIPNSVTSIGSSAFYGCARLTSVTIPNSVTSIGSSAFSGCTGLTSVTIPYSVTSIESGAFENCTSLTAINVVANNSVYISENGVLYNKNKTLLHTYPSGKKGSFTIPNSVTSIGAFAFNGCVNLKSVTIGNSVTSIGNHAFLGCESLTSITIPNSVTSIGAWAFFDCTSLASITIPNSITSIEQGAFSDCASLTSITIPDSVTSIGAWAFSGCASLTSITIPDSVTSIEQGAFSGCTGLTSVTIPYSVTSIESGAFENCTSLTAINVDSDNSAYTAQDGVLYNKNKTTLVAYPSATGILNIPNSVTSIGDRAFSYCTSLASVTIGNGVTSIGDWAFDNCTSLTSVTFQGTIASNGFSDYAFYDLGDLRAKYLKGGIGTYRRLSGTNTTWMKQ